MAAWHLYKAVGECIAHNLNARRDAKISRRRLAPTCNQQGGRSHPRYSSANLPMEATGPLLDGLGSVPEDGITYRTENCCDRQCQ
jgi:hypothetical protein